MFSLKQKRKKNSSIRQHVAEPLPTFSECTLSPLARSLWKHPSQNLCRGHLTPKNMFVSVRQLVIEILWKYRLFPGGPRIRVTSSVTFKGNFVLAFIRELSTWVIHTKTWPRDVLRGGKNHPYLSSQINMFSLTMWTTQEVAHSPYWIQTKNLSSPTVSPQRTLLLKERNLAWDPRWASVSLFTDTYQEPYFSKYWWKETKDLLPLRYLN